MVKWLRCGEGYGMYVRGLFDIKGMFVERL